MDSAKITKNQGNVDVIRSKLQLTTVRGVDPDASSVVDLAGRTALYNYDKERETWSKTDVEGTLMIYTRNAKPRNMITIINKNSKSNFIEPITKNCDAQLKTPYVLLRDDNMKILGIWIADQEDVPRIFDTICSFIRMEEEEGAKNNNDFIRTFTGHSSIASETQNAGNIMSMLSKARVDFDTKNEPVNDNVRAGEKNVFSDFFAKVSSKAGLPVHPVSSSETDPNPVLQQLFQGAAAVGGQASVINNNVINTSSIPIPGSASKQSTQPASGSVGTGGRSLPQSAPISVQELEGKLRENIHLGEKPYETTKKPNLIAPQMFTLNNTKSLIHELQIQPNIASTLEQSSSGSLLSNSGSGMIMSPDARVVIRGNDFSKSSTDSGISDPIALFQEKNDIEKLLGVGQNIENILPNGNNISEIDASSIMNSSVSAAAGFSDSNHSILLSRLSHTSDKNITNNDSFLQNLSNNVPNISPLNQTQFALALMQALKNEEFVRILHEAYMEVADQKGFHN